MNRLLSRRDKDRPHHLRQRSKDRSPGPADKNEADTKEQSKAYDLVGSFKYDAQRKLTADQEAKIKSMRERLTKEGYGDIEDQELQYGLFSMHANGEVEKALEVVRLFRDSSQGIIKDINPTIDMRGAVNRGGVTCWLDSLLFSMFAQLRSFEPILYTLYEDEPRKHFSTLLRLWVNLLRTGVLINTDVTHHLLEALQNCGWEASGHDQQQDASEAFSFITEKLQLPLLTLKMDLYHQGVQDAKDDHKRIYERLLEVAIPPSPEDGQPLKLEACLENYFNSKVEVKRILGRSQSVKLNRSDTMSSVQSHLSEKEAVTHVEVAELSSPSTPISIHPSSSPQMLRERAPSIIRRRLVEEDQEPQRGDLERTHSRTAPRKQSLRNEVTMPAFQFFNLIPWFTKPTIPSDASLAAHFSQERPVLGICLKRYAMDEHGNAMKNSTYVDIPLEIQFPHFVTDEASEDEGPSMGNFKLVLQSVIFHHGASVHEGHYFSCVRATEASDGDSSSARRLSTSDRPPKYPSERWIRHNDISNPRIQLVDILKELEIHTPYLLFYQVLPIFEDGLQGAPSDIDSAPPSYDSGIDIRYTEASPVIHRNPYHAILRQQQRAQEQERNTNTQEYFPAPKDDSQVTATPSVRLSIEIDGVRESVPTVEHRRGSAAFTVSSIGSGLGISIPEASSAPTTPAEESATQRLSRAASRFRKSGSKSRPTSSSGENRFSATFSRLAGRSKEQLNKAEASPTRDFTAAPVLQGTGNFASEELTLKPPSGSGIPSRKPSKREKTRGKPEINKDLDTSRDETSRKHGNVLHKSKQVEERECVIM